VLDTIPMNIELFGNLADADEIKFFVQKGNGAYEIQHALSIGSASNYNFNWIPSASGSYSLKAAATINGIDVTHIIVGNIVVEEPLGAKYIALRNQPVYRIGEKVKMNVALLGDFKHVTQLKFIVQKTGKSRSVVKSLNVSNNQDIYRHRWAPTETGTYRLRVNAYSNGVFVTYVQANITVINPMKITYRFLKNNQSFAVGSAIKMNVRVSGNMSNANQMKFVVQKEDGANQVIKSNTIKSSQKVYNKKWVPRAAGNYKLKVEAYKNGTFVTITVVNIKVTENLQFRAMVVEEEEKEKVLEEITTYPNPSNGIVNINLGSVSDAFVKVSSANGQLVYQQTGLSGRHQFELKGNPGLYFIEVSSETGTQYFKMIKK
jgi:hypothetical protein